MEKISFPPHKKDWKTFELNNTSITLNILYISFNTKEIKHAYKSKYIMRENQVIPLIITDCKKSHYLAVISLPALLIEITTNHMGDAYC